jgi:hypothetical protein
MVLLIGLVDGTRQQLTPTKVERRRPVSMKAVHKNSNNCEWEDTAWHAAGTQYSGSAVAEELYISWIGPIREAGNVAASVSTAPFNCHTC